MADKCKASRMLKTQTRVKANHFFSNSVFILIIHLCCWGCSWSTRSTNLRHSAVSKWHCKSTPLSNNVTTDDRLWGSTVFLRTSAAHEKIPPRQHSKVPRRPVSYFLLQSAGSAAAQAGRRLFSLLRSAPRVNNSPGCRYCLQDRRFFSLPFFLLANTTILLCQGLKMAKGNQQTWKKRQLQTHLFCFIYLKKKKEDCVQIFLWFISVRLVAVSFPMCSAPPERCVSSENQNI